MAAAYDPRDHEPQLRVSDDEREAVAATVRSALDAGRLHLDELDDRLGAVYNAKTHGDLVEVIADVVPRRRESAPAQRPSSAPATAAGSSDRRILPAFLLCFFLGVFGVHRFYAGKVGSGIAMLVLTITVVGLLVTSVWALVDLIVLAVGSFRDGRGRLIREWI